MRDARIRLLFGKDILQEDKSSAMQAAERFGRFGLKVESLESPDPRVWKDRCREQVFKLVYDDKPIVVGPNTHFYEPVYIVPNDGAILVGITSSEMWYAKSGYNAPIDFLSLYNVGVVLSVARMKVNGPYRSHGPADEQEAEAAKKIVLIRELANSLFGSGPMEMLSPPESWKRYCPSKGCVLEKDADYLTLIRKRQMDFCAPCADMIAGAVIQLKYHGCA